MSPTIAPLTQEHVPDAAALMSRRYRRLRRTVPQLPRRYEDQDVLAPMIQGIVGSAPGVVAVGGGCLMGFMAALLIPSFKGRRAAFSPEWANAAEGHAGAEGDTRVIYERMVAAVAGEWVAAGCTCHLIGQFPDDADALDAWFHQGFGLLCIDAVRDLGLPAAPLEPVEVRRAVPTDLAAVAALSRGLSDHVRASPIFLSGHPDHEAILERQLADERIAIWVAPEAGMPVAYMRIGPANDDACGIIMDAGTASITGAYAVPDVRRKGVATALLRACLAWAAERGYERCAVDFESANIEGSRFWRRHFRPVCYSLMRWVDETLVAVEP